MQIEIKALSPGIRYFSSYYLVVMLTMKFVTHSVWRTNHICRSVNCKLIKTAAFRVDVITLISLGKKSWDSEHSSNQHASIWLISPVRDPFYWECHSWSVVSGLSSSKVSASSMLIKEFCKGKAGWNDRAVFIETDLIPHQSRSGRFSGILESMAKARPKCFALCTIRTPISLRS